MTWLYSDDTDEVMFDTEKEAFDYMNDVIEMKISPRIREVKE